MSQRYSEEVHEFVRKHVKGKTAKELAKMTNERFGTNFTASSMKSYKANHKLNSGPTGRFEKGDKPWNTVPVGTVTTKTDGYLWKKIDNKPGTWLQNWRQLHLLIWEEANGPIPEGYRVIFKDKDKQNCVLENLALVSLTENAVMNRSRLRFENPDCTEAGILIAKIKIAARKRKKKG